MSETTTASSLSAAAAEQATPVVARSFFPEDVVAKEAFAPATAPRRVLVFAPLAYSTPHFETDLEIAQRHLDLGDEVDLALCDGELPACQLNPLREAKRCAACVSRNLQGAAQLSRTVRTLHMPGFLTADDLARIEALPKVFANQAALRAFRFEAFDAGMATLSSLIDFVRSDEVDTRQHAGVIHQLLAGAVQTYLTVLRALEANAYDRVYIYNGRWSMVRSAVRACEKLGVPYYTHERGADFHRFALFKNTLPHDMGDYRTQIRAAWENAKDNTAALASAHEFFTGRRQRVEKSWFSYTKEQELGRLPADWASTQRRFVVFTSSEFEFAAIGSDTGGRLYQDQVQGVARIAELLARLVPEARLWVRVHPNDNGEATAKTWRETTSALANVTLVGSKEKIDSYAMLDGAERIITFGSTIGIEATYWRHVSIVLNDGFYAGLGAVYEPADEAELIDLLLRQDVAPLPRETTLPFGYYSANQGETFRHFETAAISDYEFKSPFRGRCLKPDLGELQRGAVALFGRGEYARTEAIARLCIAFNPADSFGHTTRILSLIKLGQVLSAVFALETAATTAAPLVKILPLVVKPLFETFGALGARGDVEGSYALTQRLARVCIGVPEFAGIGRSLATLPRPSGIHAVAV
jgi:hypothetical protein